MTGLAPGREAGAVSLGRERTFVRRVRLLSVLTDSSTTPVVCLLAPGGYGKTTLLRQWVHEDERPVVWVTAHAHADATTLVHQILDAMAAARLAPATGIPPDSGLVAWHRAVVPLVQRVVSQAPAFLLVIDEAETMSGDRWDSLLTVIASSLSVGAQLAIGTRGPMPPALVSLRAEGAVRVLGVDLLAFDPVEGADTLRLLRAPVTGGDVHAVMEQTQGWPVAVYLSGLAATYGGDPTRGGRLRDADLSDYLRTQILDRLDRQDADFLLRVSVLDTLDVAACDAIGEWGDSAERLARMASSNQLLVPDEVRADTYRMHPLLSSFLREELRRRDPGAWRDAHARASLSREQAAEMDAAVYHARLSGDDARLGSLVWSQAARLFTHGQASVLQRWTDGMDDTHILAEGRLALVCAYVAALRGDLDRARQCRLAAARAAEQGAPIAPDVNLLTATMAAESVDHLNALVQHYLDARDDTDPWLTLAAFLQGVASLVCERPDEASQATWRAYHLSLAHDLPAMRARSLAVLANLALAEGDDRASLGHIREAREVLVRYRLDTVASAAPVVVASARGYVIEGRLVDAHREAVHALQLTSLMGVAAAWNVVHGRLALAQVFLALRETEQAESLLREVEAAYRPPAQSPLATRLMVEIRQALAATPTSSRGAPVITTAEMRVLQYLPTHLSLPQIAAELYLSRHTVKSQALAAYRKLDAHTRSEAVEKARRAGLLPRP
jgi:LuxR family maltose regulon positive regulatory protein